MKKTSKKNSSIIIIFLVLILLLGFSWIYLKLKKQVEDTWAWQPTVYKILDESDMLEYEPLVMSIIYTETKGKKIDVMQSSESKYGKTDKILTSEESIVNGISYLSEALALAEQENTDIWTAVQAYNFGLNYIPYVASRGGVNSVSLAEEYSKTVLAPLLGNETEKTYRYIVYESIFYNGGKLYRDGGNFFYASVVENNMKWIPYFIKY